MLVFVCLDHSRVPGVTVPPPSDNRPVSVVLPTASARTALRPLSATNATITDGFWADRIRLNREQTLPHGFAWLKRSGTLGNFRVAAGAPGRYEALGEQFGVIYPFLDSDAYKWLEAVGWELGREHDPALAASADEAIEAVRAAQRPDGYLNTYVQVVAPGTEFQNLAWGHELYCIGHLIQAAVAWHRALGDDRLLDVALRAVETIERELGPAGRDGIDGHPEIEMALVELYRTTGDRRHLELGVRMLELRGRGLIGEAHMGAAYWQDHLPVREAPTVAGHAVRQMYLDCGVVDAATELADGELLDAVRRRWDDMVESRMYLTGGIGSRHRDEAFGDPFELPPDVAYNETCAAIASVMLGWRLLLATGDRRYADGIERTMYNAVLGGSSLDGCRFAYDNPLQRRTHRTPDGPDRGPRTEWKLCACCPPNLMRTLSTWQQYLATTDAAGVQVHQFAASEIVAPIGEGAARLAVSTGYPWSGGVAITVAQTPVQPWTLSVRAPTWAGQDPLHESRSWRPGETIEFVFDMLPRVTLPDPRVDAIRGTAAFERGPFVYAVESADLDATAELEALRIRSDEQPTTQSRDDLADGVVGLVIRAEAPDGAGVAAPAIPYFAWGNRDDGAMRVWIPEATDPTNGRAAGPSTPGRPATG
jgi:uncharacterized protein